LRLGKGAVNDTILIEDKSSGVQLIQELRSSGRGRYLNGVRTMKFVLKNGVVVTPTGILHGGFVAEDGIIEHIGSNDARSR
jgi:hypothetical protein